MAYEPTNWKTGDVVTSSKLNKLENGVANAGGGNFIVTFSLEDDKSSFDKTVAEIKAAAESGQNVIMFNAVNNAYSSTYLIKQVEYEGETIDQVSFFCYAYRSNDNFEVLELQYFSDGFIDIISHTISSNHQPSV